MFGIGSIKATSQRKCAEMLLALDNSHRREVMAQLCFDRIGQKQQFIVDRFHDTTDWSQTAYLMLLRSLDIKDNRASYERLAHILPYHYFVKASFDYRSVVAMLLGCSGLLSRLSAVMSNEEEVVKLQSIFDYELRKYGFEQMEVEAWQLVGHSGGNHPIVRLLQLAGVLSRHEHLLDDILACKRKRDVEQLFCKGGIPKWAYRFLPEEGYSGAISRNKAYMLGINVVAQLQIFYSEYTMREDLDSRGVELLEQLPAESNLFINRWAKLGIKAESALESQALLQLTKVYCSNLACDKCPFRRFVDAE